jgi:carbonic anhydrase
MQKSIKALIEGYQRFRHLYFEQGNSDYAQLVQQGQKPQALMIACSDSRVDPALVMNCQPGDLFVIRNVANLVPPYEDDQAYHGTSAALEFGICVLGIQHVILFGHTPCGGIQALLERSHEKCSSSFLVKWMELARTACEATQQAHVSESFEEKVTYCGRFSLMHSLENLMTFPWIFERVQRGSLFLHAWNFDMSTGVLESYDEKTRCFRPIDVSTLPRE